MPAIKIFRSLTTRPFASDDMHIVCCILSLYRAIQLICLVPIGIGGYLARIQGKQYTVNGVPSWCAQYDLYNFTYTDNKVPIFEEELTRQQSGIAAPSLTYVEDSFWNEFMGAAIAYWVIDVAWIIMVWYSASIGTPTEPMRRDKYIRRLAIFKTFLGNLYPVALLVMGIYHVYDRRNNNYGCGESEILYYPDSHAWYGFFCALLVSYALELLVWPAIVVNKVVRIFRIHIFRRSRVEGRGGKAERFERKLGCLLKCLQCATRGKMGGKDLKNRGELAEFASHIMDLLNNETKLDLVMTDMYVGFRMLSLIQAEMKMKAIKSMSAANKMFREKVRSRHESAEIGHDANIGDKNELSDIAPARRKLRRRGSMFVLEMRNDRLEVCEREVLHESFDSDRAAMTEGTHFVRYASLIYVKLPYCVMTEFAEGEEEEEECSGFRRELDALFCRDFRLTSLDCGDTMLCYANFINGMVATPYCILVDEEVEKVVVVVRGTRSIEDLVVDVQFVPESLAKVGNICGFDGAGHFCHKGFLARCKWMYNDIKKNKVLKTLYSERSPFKDFPLVLCGHSLGAGCASILALMLRPSFPSLKCFAYEPPGCIFDEEMSKKSEEFVTSFIRHDDLVPRLSFHNFEMLREGFFDAFQRIKVPKIKLFFHWRTPHSDSFVAVRNAMVLRKREDIRKDTAFNQKLELLKAERAEKNAKGVNQVQLFVPGKIVHLVDHSLDGQGYTPYWANRSEFNQLVISKRMYADHDIHSLVDILRETQLGGNNNSASLAFFNPPQIREDEEDAAEDDVVLFSCCSNPYGKLPIILWILGLGAQALSTAAVADCDFFSASFTLAGPDIDESVRNESLNMTFGLYSYGRLGCDNATSTCAELDDYTATCVPFPPDYEVGQTVKAAWAFQAVAAIIGYVALFMIAIAMCFIYRQRTWLVITILLLLTTLFQGLVLIFKKELTFCSDPLVACAIGPGSIKMIASTVCWFVIAVGAGYLAKKGKFKQYPKRSSGANGENKDDGDGES